MKYNQYSSVCDTCGGKGWFEKPEPCSRTLWIPCETCGSCENAEMAKCKGMNRIINYSDIAKKFVYYYENQERIKVKFSTGEVKSGRVGMTIGRKPSFLLMLRSNSTGSSWTLSGNDEII